MSESNKQLSKAHVQNNIRFLEDQLIALDHYLPETYEYLMRQLDLQRRTLAELEVEEHFSRTHHSNEPHD